MILSPELIASVKTKIDIKQYFEVSENCTANHILFEQFIDGTKWKGLPKIIFYILMQDEYGQPCYKDEKGNLGYRLSLVNPEL